MKNQRIIRINEEIKREMSDIINYDLKDPRVQDVIISVTEIDATNDLKEAKAYISVLADDDKREDVMDGINTASGYIRRLIAKRINLRHTPEFTYILDTSIEYGVKMSKKIDEIVNDEENKDSEK